jgi:hypothetical protein
VNQVALPLLPFNIEVGDSFPQGLRSPCVQWLHGLAIRGELATTLGRKLLASVDISTSSSAASASSKHFHNIRTGERVT